MVDGKKLQNLCAELCHNLTPIIYHDTEITNSTWKAPLKTGKALEFLSLCSLLRAAEDNGFKVVYPDVYFQKPDLFYLRNIVPRHHGAQAGHEAAFGEIDLADRFLAALLPKATLEKKGQKFSFYREGCPIHAIEYYYKNKVEYALRPDLLVISGEVEVKILETEALFAYKHGSDYFTGSLRVKNDIKIPLVAYDNRLSNSMSTLFFVECSVGKTTKHAISQLDAYKNLYKSNSNTPLSMLVNGKGANVNAYDVETYLNLEAEGDQIENILMQGANNLISLVNSKFIDS